MKLAVLILNWNGLADTRECLLSLLPAPEWATVYVIDNGSSDDSVRVLSKEFQDRIRLIETGENLLFAGGNNVGIRTALSEGCDAVLLLNNDTQVEPGTLAALADAAERHPATLLCPKILYSASREVLWYAGGIWSGGRVAHRGIREQDRGQFDREESTAWGTGCALWIPRDVIETIGVLDRDFRLYSEDVEYCLRARKAGVTTVYVPAARVWHKVSAALGGHGTWKKQKRKLASLRLLLRKLDADLPLRLAAYAHFFVGDPVRALLQKLR
ncbi:MAG: glycosyltransferase family 2 protein [bacterium]|nr:glycosyltransferase family 2 protein [bacterium]